MTDTQRLDWLQRNKKTVEMLAGEFRIVQNDVPYPNDDLRNVSLRIVIDMAALVKESTS